ncbi:MAG: C_GCAxxG_C_C family protein [Prolixibacteraceae bacterium]|nr:C_GCAxxG_C_C family protein [Prolixibacteraceae bacterium]
MKTIKKETVKLKAKRTFLKKGTCSRTFFYILNREFGYPNDNYETAVDPLAGGIVQQGYQCGMLWGAAMAVGAEAYRRYPDMDEAIAVAVSATRIVLDSFKNKAGSIECGEITNTNWSDKYGMLKYFLSGKMVGCFRLAGKWAPNAVEAAKKGLDSKEIKVPEKATSCASELIKKMGGTDEEAVMAAGLAGGLGLSGNGCGALAAAVWMKTLDRVRKGEWKYMVDDPLQEKIIDSFFKITEYKIECSKITGQMFETFEEHSEYIKNGGCKKIIETLAQQINN